MGAFNSNLHRLCEQFKETIIAQGKLVEKNKTYGSWMRFTTDIYEVKTEKFNAVFEKGRRETHQTSNDDYLTFETIDIEFNGSIASVFHQLNKSGRFFRNSSRYGAEYSDDSDTYLKGEKPWEKHKENVDFPSEMVQAYLDSLQKNSSPMPGTLPAELRIDDNAQNILEIPNP